MYKALRFTLVSLLMMLCGTALADDYVLYSGDITPGDYVVVYGGKAMKATISSNRLGYTEVTVADNKIVDPDASILWTVAADGDYFTLYNADAAKYAASNGTKNQAKLEDAVSDNSRWTVTGTETYEFVNKANAAANVNSNLRNNGTYGFACYSTSTGGALSLYKKAAGSDDPAEDKYVIAGSSEALFGTTWSGTASANEMAKNAEGIYEKTYTDVTLPASNIEYKIVKNGSEWIPDPGDNKVLAISESGIYNVVFTFDASNQNISAQATKTGDAVIDPVYYAVGVADLWGAEWDATNAANKLTKGDDGKFSITKENVILVAGEYGYKIVKDGAWIPEGTGNEKKLAITEDGVYTITLTVDPADVDNYVATAEKTTALSTIAQAQAAEKGASVLVKGVVMASAASGAVIKDDTDLLYYYNGSNKLTIGQKVLMTGALGEYGGAKQLTYAATIKELGTEDVTYPEATELKGADFDAIKTAAVAERKFVTFVGHLTISGNYYNITVDGAEEAVASIVKPNEDISELNDKDVAITGYLMYVNGNYVYTVATKIEEYVTPIDVTDGYYLVGTMNEWTPAQTDELKANEGAEGEYMITLDMTTGAKIKVVKIESKAIAAWYPDGEGNDYEITKDANYTVYFRPAGNTEWANGFFYVAENVPAQTATFDFASADIRENIGTAMADTKGWIYNETFTADGVTLQITAGSAPTRIYTDASRGQNLVTYKEYTTLTFKAPEGKAITKIEFTAAGNSNINNFTASSGAIEGMIWTGNADGVRFTQGATSYLANAIVTLADKGDATAALPAIEYTECTNIAAFNALEAGTYAKITLTDAEVIGKSADGYSTVWVQDATGGAWIQYTSLNDKLQEKTKINGTIYTIKRATSGNPHLKEAEDTPKSEFTSTEIDAYTIVEGTIDEVNVAANLNKVVKINGATLTMTSTTTGTLTLGESTIAVNNGAETTNQQLHKIADWEKDKTLENIIITAILVAKSATENQLLPISIEAVPVYNLVGSFETWTGEDENVIKEEVTVEGLFATKWDAENAEDPNVMVYDEETGNYTLSFTNIELPGKGNILYKVVKNHSWDENYGTDTNGNCYYWVNEAGKYDITFTLNLKADTAAGNWLVSCNAVKSITDGIANIKAAQENGAAIYTLQGVRVNNVKKGGLYIVNGRKIAVK